MKEAINHSKDSLYKARLSANFARMYEQQGNSDSASVNLQRALDYLPRQQNHALAANIYKTWTSFEENKGNYQNALEKYKLYSEHLAKIITENKNAAVLEIEKKYDFQLIENKNKQLQIQRQRTLLLSSTLLLILVLLILVFLLRSIKRERELKEAEQKILQMQLMARRFNEKENSFQNIFMHHLDILKKTALIEKYLREDERKKGERLLSKFNEVVYGQKNMDWPLLYQALNKASNNYFDQLEKRLTQLDESEFRICCLIYAGFDNTEIALILNYRVNTVEVKKSSIRKKLGMDNRVDIREFLKD